MNGVNFRLGKVNIIGIWTHRDLLDAVCALTELHWEIDGKTLLLENDKASK